MKLKKAPESYRPDSVGLRAVLVMVIVIAFAGLWLTRPLWSFNGDNLEAWTVTVLENRGDKAVLCGEWGKEITVQFHGKVPCLTEGQSYRIYFYRYG